MLLHRENRALQTSLAADHVLGSAAAPVVILEYGCYCCSRETQAHAAIRSVLECFPEEVAFVYRHYPLVVTYPTAFDAAEAVEASAAQGHFWEMHNYLAEHAHPYSREELIQIASDLDIDADALAWDLNSHSYCDLVKVHFQSGVRSGVRRVPAVFVNGLPLRDDVTVGGLRDTVVRAAARAHDVLL